MRSSWRLAKNIRLFQPDKILNWAETNTRSFSWRSKLTPYRILVAELLLRRTTAQAVDRIYESFVKKYPDLQALSGADVGVLEQDLKTIGYNVQRSKVMKEVATDIIKKFGDIPEGLEQLMSVKHIGLYTAAAVVSLGYGKPLPMVDSNIIRVIGRYYGKKMSQIQVFELLRQNMPKEHQKFNLAMLDFGALVCRYGVPLCYKCPVSTRCSCEPKTREPRFQ